MTVILAALNSKYVHSNLAIRYLKSSSKDYDIDIFEATINENLMNVAINIALKNPELIGFSCYIWNMETTLKVCSILKEINSNIKIVLGGPEVSYDSSKIMGEHDYIDFIIKGEGEFAFKKLLDTLYSNKSQDLYCVEGLVHRSSNKIVENGASCTVENLDAIPFPYGEEVPDRIVYYEASRGCPFGCKYCLSSTLKGVRFFSLDRVKKDLKFFIDKNVRLVKFVDRTFNANKNFAIEVWKFLIDNHKNTKFHFEIAADILDNETIEVLKSAPKDLFQFEIGVQSTNVEVLKNIDRVMDFEKVKENVERIMEGENIHCHLDLIVGLPGENLESFNRSVDMVMDIRPDMLQIGFLKVLKGSPIYFEAEKYDIHYVKSPPYHVLYTKDISFREIESLLKFEEVFEIYYNSKIFDLTMNYVLSMIESPFEFFISFKDFAEERGFFDRKLDLKERFRLFFDFLSKYYDERIIRDLLLHDFVANTKKSNIPDFLKIDYPEELKEKFKENRDKVIECFGEVDFKRVFYAPVSITVHKEYRKLKIENSSGILVFNLQNGEYCYI
jgi:radical SAM superfamily enzyme YgiQ (UPF0313 family)